MHPDHEELELTVPQPRGDSSSTLFDDGDDHFYEDHRHGEYRHDWPTAPLESPGSRDNWITEKVAARHYKRIMEEFQWRGYDHLLGVFSADDLAEAMRIQADHDQKRKEEIEKAEAKTKRCYRLKVAIVVIWILLMIVVASYPYPYDPKKHAGHAGPAGVEAATLHPMTMTALLTIVGSATRTDSFLVYDCDDRNTTYATIDLTEPKECDEISPLYQEPQVIRIQVLQTQMQRSVVAYQCYVVVTKVVTRCGFTSISYSDSYPVLDELVEITPQHCREAVDQKVIHYDGRALKFKLGWASTHRWFSHGNLDENHDCKTETFTTNNQIFYNSYERTRVKVLVRALRGTADPADGTIVLNGVRGRYQDGVIQDALQGTMVWHPQGQANCSETVSEIYHGPANISRQLFHTEARGVTGDLIVLTNTDTEQYAGLILKGITNLCGVRTFHTQIRGIQVAVLTKHDRPVPNAQFRAHVDIKTTSIQTQLSYHHIATNMHHDQLFSEVWTSVCQMERKIAQGKLQDMAGATDPYATLDTHGHGHQLLKAGAVTYIGKCLPLEAQIREESNCTQEIPVSVKGTNRTNLYADPLSFIIQPYPTVVPCDNITPIRWKIGEHWLCATPRATPCLAPQQLNLESNDREGHNRYHFLRGLGSDAYSEEQEMAHYRFEQIKMAREPLLNDLTTNAVYAAHDGRLGPAFSMDDEGVSGLAHLIGAELMPLYDFFGRSWYWISGTLFVGVCFQIVGGTLIRIGVGYQRRGWGMWILTTWWHTLWSIFCSPVRFIWTAGDMIVPPMNARQRAAGGLGEEAGTTSHRRPPGDDDDDDGAPPGIAGGATTTTYIWDETLNSRGQPVGHRGPRRGRPKRPPGYPPSYRSTPPPNTASAPMNPSTMTENRYEVPNGGLPTRLPPPGPAAAEGNANDDPTMTGPLKRALYTALSRFRRPGAQEADYRNLGFAVARAMEEQEREPDPMMPRPANPTGRFHSRQSSAPTLLSVPQPGGDQMEDVELGPMNTTNGSEAGGAFGYSSGPVTGQV